MRFYIEAFEPLNGPQILGNLDGQAALGEMKSPKRSKLWRTIKRREIDGDCGPQRVGRYDLVNECGAIIDTAANWRLKQ